MHSFESIRTYFQPIQPSVGSQEGEVVYQEFLPSLELQPFIHCYWHLHAPTPLVSPFDYRVVSDGCIDVFFNLKNARESFVMGFCKKYTEFSLGKEFDFGGIRFYPSIFPLLFGISAKDLSDKSQSLQALLPDFAEVINQLPKDFPSAIPKINTYLKAVVQEQQSPDPRFYQAFVEILQKKGNLETESDLDTGISPRQLRRLFNYYIGTTPKSFSQVVRFQYILHASPSRQNLQDPNIFYDVGFFDQAHFIKNFTKFYGITPGKALR